MAQCNENEGGAAQAVRTGKRVSHEHKRDSCMYVAGIMNNGNENVDKMAAHCFFSCSFFCSIPFVAVLFSFRFRGRVVMWDLHKYV